MRLVHVSSPYQTGPQIDFSNCQYSLPMASSRVNNLGGDRLTFSSDPVLRTFVSFFSRTGLTCTIRTAVAWCACYDVLLCVAVSLEGLSPPFKPDRHSYRDANTRVPSCHTKTCPVRCHMQHCRQHAIWPKPTDRQWPQHFDA